MVLVDTSVWISHFRAGSTRLQALLIEGEVLCHPAVLGELACGNLSNRKEIFSLLRALPIATQALDDDVIHFLESRKLYGKGIGWIDAHLLCSARLSHATLWTLDRALRRVYETLD